MNPDAADASRLVELDVLIAEGKEALAVFAIHRSVGGPLPEAYRLLCERLDVHGKHPAAPRS